MSAKLQAKFDEAYAQHERGDLDRAQAGYKAVLKQLPDHAPSLYLLGLIAHARKEYKQAVRYYKQVIEITPRDADAWFEMANSLHEDGCFESALDVINKAIGIDSGNADYFCNKALILKDLGFYEDSVSCLDVAIGLDKSDPDLWYNRGNVLRLQKMYVDALYSYAQALKIDNNYYDVWNCSGLTLNDMNQYSAAVGAYEKAISICDSRPEAWCNLAYALYHLNKNERALSCLDRAWQLSKTPEQYFSILEGRGLVLLSLNRPVEAEAVFRDALMILPKKAPASHFNLAVSLLVQGRLEEGFAEYEFRLLLDGKYKALPSPVWDGEEGLKGKTLLLRSEQGLGDLIQFVRYAILAVDMGAKVVIEAPKPLFRLFASIGSGVEVVDPEAPTPEHDFHLPLLSMPKVMKTNLNNIPAKVPYFSPLSDAVSVWERRIINNSGLRVGLVWSGNVDFQNDQNRSIPLCVLSSFFDVSGVQWFSLQKLVRASDREFFDQSPLIDMMSDVDDFSDTAALMSCLDLIISVDTATAHLAGALGKPTWLLSPFSPDFRWLLDREDSPWYPSMRLFRQKTPGDWDGVVEGVKFSLRELVACRVKLS